MDDSRSAPLTIDEYIATCRIDVRPILERVRDTIRKAAPAAEERISYRMPAFFECGAVVYFAAFKNHIGLFPPVQDESLRPKLAKYAGEKGNLRFPLDEPIPYSLITQVVKARLKENRSRKAARVKKSKAV
jgi:uncharacterized protein YdhG (YjbR/CyaY superfamily)